MKRVHPRAASPASYDAVDEAFLDRALTEVLGSDSPPDLVNRVLGASAADRGAAAAAVDRAASPRPRRWRTAAALLLLGCAGVLAVDAAQARRAAAAQDSPTEINVADAAELAGLARRIGGLTLVARRDASGAR